MKTIRTGSEALLVYPEGDCDYVEVLKLSFDWATVKVPGSAENPFHGSRVITVPVEDIGIGVDDELQPVFDSERDNRRWATMQAWDLERNCAGGETMGGREGDELRCRVCHGLFPAYSPTYDLVPTHNR